MLDVGIIIEGLYDHVTVHKRFNDQERPIKSMNSYAQVQKSKARKSKFGYDIYTRTHITSQETSISQANLPKLNSTDQVFKSKGH